MNDRDEWTQTVDVTAALNTTLTALAFERHDLEAAISELNPHDDDDRFHAEALTRRKYACIQAYSTLIELRDRAVA